MNYYEDTNVRTYETDIIKQRKTISLNLYTNIK